MSAYDKNLKHVAQPADPTQREQTTSATLVDYEALWLAEQLREFSHYSNLATDEKAAIATAYVEHIDSTIREQQDRHVDLYAHTAVAAETLMDSCVHYVEEMDDPHNKLIEDVREAISPLYTNHHDESGE